MGMEVSAAKNRRTRGSCPGVPSGLRQELLVVVDREGLIDWT